VVSPHDGGRHAASWRPMALRSGPRRRKARRSGRATPGSAGL